MSLRRTASVVLTVSLVIAVQVSPSAAQPTHCFMRGPHYVVHAVHDLNGPGLSGTRYALGDNSINTSVSCTQMKRIARTLIRRNPKWPFAGRLKGAPPGWFCYSLGYQPTDRANHSGRCSDHKILIPPNTPPPKNPPPPPPPPTFPLPPVAGFDFGPSCAKNINCG